MMRRKLEGCVSRPRALLLRQVQNDGSRSTRCCGSCGGYGSTIALHHQQRGRCGGGVLPRHRQRYMWSGVAHDLLRPIAVVKNEKATLATTKRASLELRGAFSYWQHSRRATSSPSRRRFSSSSSSHVIYAVGEGWTGALGTGRIDQVVRGHFDDLEDDIEPDGGVPMSLPSPMHILDASIGWGHSAIIASSAEATGGGADDTGGLVPTIASPPQLYVTGRPHEFASLLRLRRLPRWLRNYSSRQTLRSTNAPTDVSDNLDPTSLVGRFVTYLSESFLDQPEEHWDQARMHSFLPALTRIPLPLSDHEPVSVSCSAGLTAVVTRTGHLYTLGLNQYGQCGNGHTSNNVWTPQLVTGLSSDVATHGPRSELPQSSPVTQVSLGLQHGVCLNADGEVFAFGKGDRGQLGQDVALAESHTAMAIRKGCHLVEGGGTKPTYVVMPKVVQISSGMLHCALLTDEGQVFVFGKHMLPKSVSNDPKAPAADAKIPVLVSGLPENRSVLQIASGSHHTSMLLDDGSVWGFGISSDTKEPIHVPVQLVTKEEMDSMLPVRQFTAHMDRTTIVGNDGRTVLQVHLWSDPDLREYAVFTPAWIERLLLNDPDLAIEQVHRGWIHSLVVATKNV